MSIAASPRRSVLEQTAEGLQYRIRPKKQLGTLITLPFGLAFWSYFEAMKIREVLDGAETLSLFDWVWLAVWTFGGLATIYGGVGMLIGEEIITVTSRELAIQRNVSGLEPIRHYDLVQLRNLRVSGSPPRRRQDSVFGPGLIAFDYGAKTIRFGGGVDEAEASMIVAELKARHGQLFRAG